MGARLLWLGWADGKDCRLVLVDCERINIEAKEVDSLGEASWRVADDPIKKFDSPVLFAALVGLGPKPTP